MKVFFTLLAAIVSSTVVYANLQGEFEQQHMNEAHQIEVTDEVAFFKLHDINADGFWDEKELQSMYGIERDVDPNTSHIKQIIERVYDEMDMNKDRHISMDEYITAKLPSITAREEKLEREYKRSAPVQEDKPIVRNKRKSSKKMESGGVIPEKFRA